MSALKPSCMMHIIKMCVSDLKPPQETSMTAELQNFKLGANAFLLGVDGL